MLQEEAGVLQLPPRTELDPDQVANVFNYKRDMLRRWVAVAVGLGRPVVGLLLRADQGSCCRYGVMAEFLVGGLVSW